MEAEHKKKLENESSLEKENQDLNNGNDTVVACRNKSSLKSNNCSKKEIEIKNKKVMKTNYKKGKEGKVRRNKEHSMLVQIQQF